jgi:hypothetical protein
MCESVNETKIEDEFFQRLPAILDRRASILHEKKLASILVPFSEAGTFLTGGHALTLGHLLILWFACDWIQPCSECGAPAYVFQWGGSSGSGNNRWTAWCPVCNKEVRGKVKKGGQWIQPAVSEIWTPGKYSLKEYLEHFDSEHV